MRPRKTNDTKLSRQVSFRLTDPEYMRLAALAERAGVHVNEMARIFATRGDHEIPVNPGTQTDPAVIKRLDRVGWELNQLVKNAHLYRDIPPDIAALCDEIRTIIKAAVLERVD